MAETAMARGGKGLGLALIAVAAGTAAGTLGMLLGSLELTPFAAMLAVASPLAAVAGSVRLVLAGVPVR